MERFKKYFDPDKEVYLNDVPVSEIEAVTDKKFILTFRIKVTFSTNCFKYNPNDCTDSEYEEMRKYVKDNFDYHLKYLLSSGKELVEFEGSLYGNTQWLIICVTKPLTAQEVLKIKYDDEVKDPYIEDLVDE